MKNSKKLENLAGKMIEVKKLNVVIGGCCECDKPRPGARGFRSRLLNWLDKFK